VQGEVGKVKRFLLLLMLAVPSYARAANVVLILTDDMAKSDLAYMPNTRRLVGDLGASITMLHATALCSPSRATILSGRFAHNTGVKNNGGLDFGGFNAVFSSGLEAEMLPVWLHDAGYHTGFIGKYVNGYPYPAAETYVPPGWDFWASPVGGNPYAGYDYAMNQNGAVVQYGDLGYEYTTDVFAGLAVEFVMENAGAPFFLQVSTYAPHGPAVPADRHWNLFSDLQAPRTKSFNEVDVSDKPYHIQKLPAFSPFTVEDIDDQYRWRLRSLQAVDEMVAGIVDALDSAGVLSDTYIIFLSDNGYHLGQHRMSHGKQSPYEEDIQAPFLVRGPSIRPGTKGTRLAGTVDIAPTIAEMAGVDVPVVVDGRSLMSYLRGRSGGWRRYYPLEHWRIASDDDFTAFANPGNKAGIPPFVGVRSKRYLYAEYSSGAREVYDLIRDRDEMANLIDVVNLGVLRRLKAAADALKDCVGVGCWK
jgi:N-acetylglucosamine-6-sulfatase